MARADYLVLRHGLAPWVRWAHFGVSVLGIIAIAISAASTELKLIVCAMLIACAAVIYRFFIQRCPSGEIRVFSDGTSLYRDSPGKRVFGTLDRSQWISRWFCALVSYPAKRRRPQYFLVFASENDSGEYRRLLKFLRMRSAGSQAERMIW